MRAEIVDKLRSVNPEQLASLFRTVLQFGGGYLVSRGLFTDETVLAWSSGGATILVTLWGLWARNDKNLIVSATTVPGVHNVEMDKSAELSSATLTANPKVNS